MLFRCPQCRTRRKDFKLFTQHLQTSGHRICQCGGYHYAHRLGSPYCEANPVSPLLMADRYGATEDDLVRCAEYIMQETPNATAQVRGHLKKWNLYEADQKHS